MKGKMGTMKGCDCGGHSTEKAAPKRAFEGKAFKPNTSNVVSAKKASKKARK